MTRKDFELIAGALNLAQGSVTVAPYDGATALRLVSLILADRLETTNGAFDRVRFLAACGVSND